MVAGAGSSGGGIATAHGLIVSALPDGTEVDNILDGNLAVLASQGAPLPGQALAFLGQSAPYRRPR